MIFLNKPSINLSKLSKCKSNIITVFEHQALWLNKGDCRLNEEQLKALQNFYKENDFPYYSLIHNGVRFCEYVGVIQVGNLIIEVLPKADNEDEQHWRKMLVDMLRVVGLFNIHAPSSSNLNLKSNSILDLYFELFINEAEELLHKGLIKKYRKTEGNLTVLKGNILFAKQIQQNLTHQERFYVKHTVYDREHPLNCVLYKTITLLKHINTNQSLQSRIGGLLLNFPELPNIKTDEVFFEKLQYSRKTEPYKKGIDIALMFDMNSLWEKFVFTSLRKNNIHGYKITAQSSKYFWQKDGSRAKKMIPDIVIDKGNNEMVVLDTKWKNIGTYNPSDTDLRQMYAYSKFHGNAKTALLYPGVEHKFTKGKFYSESDNKVHSNNNCGILTVMVEKVVKEWQKNLAKEIYESEIFK
jgi:5-methylcytosine-specific restriction enzyme subunit McrC